MIRALIFADFVHIPKNFCDKNFSQSAIHKYKCHKSFSTCYSVSKFRELCDQLRSHFQCRSNESPLVPSSNTLAFSPSLFIWTSLEKYDLTYSQPLVILYSVSCRFLSLIKIMYPLAEQCGIAYDSNLKIIKAVQCLIGITSMWASGHDTFFHLTLPMPSPSVNHHKTKLMLLSKNQKGYALGQ